MKTHVLYNRLASNGNGLQNAQRLNTLWKGRQLIYHDITKKSYEEIFSQMEPEDQMVLCGGDGTLNRFINETAHMKISRDIYYFPCGSGNDFWHDLSLTPADEPKKINQYLVDLPTVEVKGKTYRFLNGVGYGIDGYCCEVGDQLRATTTKPINYTAIAIKGLLLHYQPTTATVTVDGVVHRYEKAWLAPTMNGRFYGGGMMPTPNQDRLSKERTVSCMLFHGSGKLRTLMAFPSIFKGQHVKKKLTAIHTGHEIHVAFDHPAALQIDGETILNVKEYTVHTHVPVTAR